MFTPQKSWVGWSRSPHGSAPANFRNSSPTTIGREKGKGVSGGSDVLPPQPLISLGENHGGAVDVKGDAKAWKDFGDTGLLDEASWQRDREFLRVKIAELEKELHDYQYNMGILLIEKKEWTSRFDEIKQSLDDIQETLKREQSAHLIALSELEKREENARKALGVEKQCVVDLEKALQEMRAEMAQVKFTSEKKLMDARALESSLEAKYLECEHKLHYADAKLAEVSRRSSEVGRVVEEIEARERIVQRDYASLNSERKTHEKDFFQQREHFQEWEENLRERQKRLVEEQTSLILREERVNEMDKTLKKKEDQLEDERKSLEIRNRNLKEKEKDISSRTRALVVKEREAVSKQENLDRKEKVLEEIAEKLEAREKAETQKLLDDHRAFLDSKTKEFETELERRRQSFDEEFKNKSGAVDKKEREINRKAEQVVKKEEAIQIRMEKLIDTEKAFDAKWRNLEERENLLRVDEKKVHERKQELDVDAQVVASSIAELERLKTALESEKQLIITERDVLEVTREERDQHSRLQSELKHELEECRSMQEAITKQAEDLRLERDRFENEWQLLDEERVSLSEESKKVHDEREKFEKRRLCEEERLKKEIMDSRAEIEKELEKLNVEREYFHRLKLHDQSVALEMLEGERVDMSREIESHKHELEIKIQKRQEELETKLQEKMDEFHRIREVEQTDLRAKTNENENVTFKLNTLQTRLEREREEVTEERKKLELDQLEIQKDIDTLQELSRQLKNQREEFIKEKDHFRTVAEQCKVCKNCGFTVKDLEILGLPLSGNERDGDRVLRSFTDYLDERTKGETLQFSASKPATSSGGLWSLLKCSLSFNLSPKMKAEPADAKVGKSRLFDSRMDKEFSDVEAADERAQSFGVEDESYSLMVLSDCLVRDNNEVSRPNKDVDEVSKIPTDNGTTGEIGELLPNQLDFQHVSVNNQRQNLNRKARPKSTTIHRTHSVKQVVEDAKVILGEVDGEVMGVHQNGEHSNSGIVNNENQNTSVRAIDAPTRGRRRKRSSNASFNTSDLIVEDSETQSGSVSIGRGRKRRQVPNSGAQGPAGKRYNLRRSTVGGTSPEVQTMAAHSEVLHSSSQQFPEKETLKSPVDGEGSTEPVSLRRPGLEKKTIKGDNIGEAKLSSLLQPLPSASADSEALVVVKSVVFSEHTRDAGEVNEEEVAAEALRTPSGIRNLNDEEEDGSDDDHGSNKHNASIGKKLWNFFLS